MIYLDAAAVVKLVRREPATRELVAWLGRRGELPLVSSALVEVEVARALRRSVPQALAGLPSVLSRLYRVEIDATVRLTAAAYDHPALRTLDAIHLATAQLLASEPGAELVAFVSYDGRLLTSAAEIGLPTASPGI